MFVCEGSALCRLAQTASRLIFDAGGLETGQSSPFQDSEPEMDSQEDRRPGYGSDILATPTKTNRITSLLMGIVARRICTRSSVCLASCEWRKWFGAVGHRVALVEGHSR